MRATGKTKSRSMKHRFERGFTMIELMVSLAVFSVFLASSAQFWGNVVHGGFQEQRQITDINQVARLAMEFVTSEVQRTGAGQLFAPRLPNTSPGYAVIPLSVADEADYGGTGAIDMGLSGDGGPAGADQLTVVYGIDGRVGRVVWDDLEKNLQLDFQLRDDTQDATNATNPNPYPFFTGFFNPAEPGPYSPGIFEATAGTWIGGLLFLKTPDGVGSQAKDTNGEKGRRAHFRVVRVTAVSPVPFSARTRYQARIQYVAEPQNPFNRWLQTLAVANGGNTVLYFDDDRAKKMKYYEDRKNASGVGNVDSPVSGVMSGCAPRTSDIDPIRACTEAMLVQMRTFYIAQPGSPANPVTASNSNPLPALAMVTYAPNAGNTGKLAMDWNLATDSVILAEGIEDLQFEYFVGRGQKNISAVAQDPQADQGVHDLMAADPGGTYPGIWRMADEAPGTHYLTGARVSLRAVMDVGKQFYSDQNAPLANRIDYSLNADQPGHPRLRRVVRQFVAFRNIDTPYAPPEEASIVVF